MILQHVARVVLAFSLTLSLAACGGGGLFNRNAAPLTDAEIAQNAADERLRAPATAMIAEDREGSSILGLFRASEDPNITVEVNKYIWQASLEVLNFLPVESVDPFTGVFTTGFGRPPGGGNAYRATVYVQDPALDARSLKVAMQGSGGGSVSPETIRAVEDAILTRARQMRIQDSGL